MNDINQFKIDFEKYTKNKLFKENLSKRTEAFNRFLTKGFPNSKQEHWKYSPLNQDLTKFKEVKFVENSDKSIDEGYFEKFDHYKIILKDGILVSESLLTEGLTIAKCDTSSFFDVKKNPILDFNNAFYIPSYKILVAKNVKIQKPVVIYNFISASFNGNNINLKCNILLDDNSFLEVYDKNIFLNNNFVFFTSNLEINISKKAVLKKYSLNSNSKNNTIYNFAKVDLDDYAFFENFNLSHNFNSCRDEFVVNLNGIESKGSLNNVQHLSRNCYHEIKWEVLHNEVSTTSKQYVKSVLNDQSTAAFQGKIYVNSIAQKTDGYQLSKALLLSDQSKFLSKPELEIYADDVKCSHGSTSGNINKDILFYLRSRGLSEKEAKNLYVEGFLADVLEKIENKEINKLFIEKLREIHEYQ